MQKSPFGFTDPELPLPRPVLAPQIAPLLYPHPATHKWQAEKAVAPPPAGTDPRQLQEPDRARKAPGLPRAPLSSWVPSSRRKQRHSPSGSGAAVRLTFHRGDHQAQHLVAAAALSELAVRLLRARGAASASSAGACQQPRPALSTSAAAAAASASSGAPRPS